MRNEASDQHFNTGILRSYLRRLGIHSAPAPDFVTLNSLHHQHLLRVPFENLDIHLGKRIVLSETAILDKLLRQGR
ncbi:MAG: arylamine N-acetyltransferase, partial [Burkholderiales bacterium]|nr:arylamine N-acetyltransferase [Burkholderiales bacterium]